MKYISKIKDSILRFGKKGLTPHEIALAAAIGIFIAFIPLYGAHTLLAIALASRLRVNTLIVVLGTQVSNPLTFPIQLFLGAQVGSLILNGSFLEIRPSGSISLLGHYIVPLLLGSLVLGIFFSSISFLLVKALMSRKKCTSNGTHP